MKGATRTHLLEEIIPEDLPDVKLLVDNDPESRFKPFQLMDTKEELSAALHEKRNKYLPFMEDYAPEIAVTRERIELDEFFN